MPLLRDYATASMREAAQNADGTINPQKLARWQAQHAEALRAMPELGPRFQNAASAAETVGQQLEAQRNALKMAQQGVAGKLMGFDHPTDVSRAVGAIFGRSDGVQTMRDLVGRLRDNPQALAGLRKAVLDHITGRFLSTAEAATSGDPLLQSAGFQKFVAKNEPILREVLDPQQVQVLKAVAADLRRANRTIVALKRPGGSDTAANLMAVARNAAGQNRLTRLILDAVGAAAGHFATGSFEGTMLGAWGADTLASMRAAGLAKVEDLVREAVLHPDAARGLLSKLPAETPRAAGRATARMITTLGAISAARATQRGYKAGGRA